VAQRLSATIKINQKEAALQFPEKLTIRSGYAF
jgi:hypothetical protein